MLYTQMDKILLQNNEINACFNNCDPRTNGEFNLIRNLKNNKIIFDVGCRNQSEFVDYFGEVHYFEILPKFLKELEAKPNKNTISFFNDVGLSDKKSEIYYYPRYESIYNRITSCAFDDSDNRLILNVITAKEYLEEKKIDEIYLLKIDVEGHEPEVLFGFGDMLSKVEMIQFEYGGTYLDTNYKLSDVLKYLSNFSFREFGYLNRSGYVKIDNLNIEDHYKYCNIICLK